MSPVRCLPPFGSTRHATVVGPVDTATPTSVPPNRKLSTTKLVTAAAVPCRSICLQAMLAISRGWARGHTAPGRQRGGKPSPSRCTDPYSGTFLRRLGIKLFKRTQKQGPFESDNAVQKKDRRRYRFSTLHSRRSTGVGGKHTAETARE